MIELTTTRDEKIYVNPLSIDFIIQERGVATVINFNNGKTIVVKEKCEEIILKMEL